MIKYYFLVLISEIIYYGSFIILIISNKNIFLLFGILGVELHNIYSLKIREKGYKKSIFFSFSILIIVLVSYIYIINKYNIDIFSFDGFMLIFSVLAFVYVEYTFYVYPLDKLYRRYKEWKWY